VLVICALALVAAAAVFLVIGLASGDVGDLYLSMVLCVASLVVVAVSARLSRVRPAPAADGPPDPVDPVGAAEAEADKPEEIEKPEKAETAETAADEKAEESADEKADAPVADPMAGLSVRLAKQPAPAAAPVDDGSIWAAGRPAPDPTPAVEPDPEPQVEPEAGASVDLTGRDTSFPIADYDDLAVAQILPLVSKLWPEEVPVVAARERATKARPAVLDALAQAAGDPSLAFPIAEYESLDTEQITRLLNRLDPSDLATVQVAERAGPARVGVLVAVANQLAARK
jgi:hypothetical protein